MFMEDDCTPPEPPKVTLLSELKDKVQTGASFHKKRSKARRELSAEDERELGRKAVAASKAKSKGPSGPRKPKKPTLQRMYNIANHQIAQRELSQKGLRDILTRRVKKYIFTLPDEERSEFEAEAMGFVDKVVEDVVSKGYVNDTRYAEVKVSSWRNRGWGRRKIEMELQKKGIGTDIADIVLRNVDLDNIDIEEDTTRNIEADALAAETLARRRKLGPFRTKAEPSDYAEKQKLWRREAGVLARAGFGMDIIHDILSRPPEDEPDF
jgi:SOS response regulatory protein OraA/RecX